MKDKIFIGILLLFFLIKGLVVSSTIPLWQAPDEFAHYSYIQSIAEQRGIPNLRNSRLSEEVAETIDQADVYPITDGKSKVFEGSLNPDYEGFKQYKNDGYLTKSFKIGRNSSNSLELAYQFTSNFPCEIGISKQIEKPMKLIAISIWVYGDKSNIPFTAKLSNGKEKFLIEKYIIDWKGWKNLLFTIDSLMKPNILDSSSYLYISLQYDPEKDIEANLNGRVFIDDIVFQYQSEKSLILTFDFESKKLRTQDSGWWNQVSQHPPFYYLTASLIYILLNNRDIYTIAYIIRLLSVIYGMLTIYFSYLIAKSLFPDNRYMYLGIPTFISFCSSFTYHTSVINNDTLVNLLYAILIYLILEKMKSPKKLHLSIIIGIISGIGMITKMTYIPAVIAVVAVWLTSSRLRPHRRFIKELILIFMIVGFISGWWYYRNYSLYGTFFTVATHVKADPRLNTITNRLNAAQILSDPDIRNWYLYSWLQIGKDVVVHNIYLVMYILAAVGLIIMLYKYFVFKDINIRKSISDMMPIITLFLIHILVFNYMIIGSAINFGIIRGIHGRYFHSVIVPFALLILVGIDNFPAKRWK
ncbi:glycosyltransferase family 39 protein, partial [bacterium]|nr:glycosyltransferase family 39 protein [bacterium]